VIGASAATAVQDSMRWARQLGPIFRRKVFDLEAVLVSGADLVAELTDDSRFGKHVGLGVANLRQLAGDGLFTAHDDEPNWQRAHDILAPGFTREAMQRYHPVMVDTAERLIARWDAHLDGSPVDAPADLTRLTLETIARAGFGYDFGSFDRREPHPFVTAMIAGLRHAQRRTINPPLIGRALHSTADRLNARNAGYLARAVDDIIRARKASGDISADDLLGLMLNTAQPGSGKRLDDANMRKQVITFLVAGHETTSGALSFALYYLVKNPAVLERAQQEVDRVWGADTGTAPAYEQVTKLRYVRRVLDESLRLWPTAPGFSREAHEDTVIGGRYRMRAGAWAFILAPMLHRDPAWGGDPEAFDPDRFAPEAIRTRPGYLYKPFGTGARACIGRQFALHEAMLVLGMLLRRYQLHDHAGYRLKVAERLTLMPEGFTVTLSRRRRAPGREPAAG
jgi:unspecific monooxygenase